MSRIILLSLSLFVLTACGGSSSNPEPPPPPPVGDTTPPVVTLTGDATINHEQGTEFVDPGATATDDTDGAVSVTVTGSVGADAGTYTLTYTATDAAGNSASVTREVIVADTTAPEVTLIGSFSINHEQGTEFVDPGATATDLVDGNVDVVITGTVGDAAGPYTLTYTATDGAGNSASETRNVNVEDTTPPVLTLNGESFIQIDVGVPFVDPGATAVDLVDGNVDVVVTGVVNENLEDDYVLTYSATDVANNTIELTRTVRVGQGNTSEDIIVLSQGIAGPEWDGGFNAFDTQAPSDCSNDGGAACPSISWRTVNDVDRGNVLEIEHSASGDFAIFFIISSDTLDLTEYRDGALIYDLKTVNGDGLYTTKLDCIFPCTSGDKNLTDAVGDTWTEVIVPLANLEASGLDLARVNTGMVVWARNHTGNIFRVDNARFVKSYTGESSIGTSGGGGPNPVDYNLMAFGAGNVSDTINPASYRCDIIPEANNRSFLYNAGIRAGTELTGCLNEPRDPQGVPAVAIPQVVGDAAAEPLQTHRWWGSVSYQGEMINGDPNSAAYITPDPISARISNTGFRVIGLPAGIRTVNPREFAYPIPDPFAEVFDGIAVANSEYNNLQGYTSKTSDGSITVEWQSNGVAVMNATFVHGSPYVYINVLDGELQLKTLREDGGEKGTYFLGTDSFGLWTNVAGQLNYFLITGDGATTFTNTTGNVIGVSNPTKSYTLTLMPTTSEPSSAMINLFEANARNVVDSVSVDYTIDPNTQAVEVTRQYVGSGGTPVTTIAGMQPLHWKYATSTQTDTGYQVRSARGVTKFVNQSSFTYELPHVGVLPALPTFDMELDVPRLTGLINDFLEVPTSQWIRNGGGVLTDNADTYWSGKAYNRVAELIAISDALGLTTQKATLMTWLKAELEDWFTAETNGELDENKYFVYDETWDTLFGMEESFGSHQQLNDHHFHYGYFVRAAAEICRHEADWCSDTNYGPMVELLIRDYAGGRDDPMFPYLRHFDPANGFSWASGSVNFIRGNNNESTSEAANSYGAMILYGLITGNEEIRQRGQYMHASTSAAYWEYWNNIGGYNSVDPDDNNFPGGYNLLATSIIWGDGGVFSTFFSGAVSYILGIQGLPTNGLVMHIGIYSDYLVDYVELGVSEGNNGKPSGLIDIDGTTDQWPDIWWNILAMTDADASIADYESVTSYDAEIGESEAHTYHWINTFKVLGQIAMGGVGPGFITADYPAAMAFTNNGVTNYIVYNYGSTNLTVNYSDGTIVIAAPQQFTVQSQ